MGQESVDVISGVLRGDEVESRILRELERLGSCTFDELVRAFPDCTWPQLFITVDRLSRAGTLILRRPTRFEYVLEAAMRRTG